MEKNLEKGELIRKKYLYRRLIMSGKVILPVKTARKLIGPDCAYHLYSTFKIETKKEKLKHGEN